MSAQGDTTPRMVVLCECGPIIGELIDLDELGRLAAQMPGVAKVERFSTLCSPEGKTWLAEKMRENPDLMPVIAACSPREHADTFAQVCEDAERNPFLMSRANVREQVAWVTPDRAEATLKAADMVAAATARVGGHEPLQAAELDCETSVLVVGAGVAGMTAALLVADAGRAVTLVEREPAVGGRAVLLSEIYPEMDCPPCLLEPLIDRVLHHPDIEVMTYAEVDELTGYLGNYTATVRRKARHVDVAGCFGCRSCAEACPVEVTDACNAGLSTRKAVYIPFMGALPNASVVDEASCLHFTGGECDACVAACPFGNIDLSQVEEFVERHVGAVIIATGSELKTAAGSAYDLPGTMTTWEFERLINPDGPTGGEIRLPDGRVPKSVALVHCADERGEAPSETCSNTCCLALAKYAVEIAHKLPGAEVVEFAWDRRLGGPHYHAMSSSNDLPATMTVVRLTSTNRLRLESAGDSRVRIVATMGGKSRELEFDLVVMAPPHVGDRGGVELALRANVDVDADGYVLPSNRQLSSFASRVEGIFAAGSAQGEKEIAAATAQAAAAAGAVLSALVPGKKLVRAATTAVVDEDLCGGCQLCTLACPYKAIVFDATTSLAAVNELLCQGCGTCAAACPSSAISAKHFTDGQILSEIRALSATAAKEPVR